jgi:hypothetical protein
LFASPKASPVICQSIQAARPFAGGISSKESGVQTGVDGVYGNWIVGCEVFYVARFDPHTRAHVVVTCNPVGSIAQNLSRFESLLPPRQLRLTFGEMRLPTLH